jgi:uncharacterized protein
MRSDTHDDRGELPRQGDRYERVGPALAKHAKARRRRRVALGLMAFLAFAGPLAYGAQRFVRQRQILFPIPTLDSTAEGEAVVLAGSLRGWIVNEGKDRALLYFSGNGEAVDTLRAEFSQLFPTRTVYLMPYPGYPPNPGTVTEPNLIQSALDLYDAVAAKYTSVGLAGRSLGTAVALQVASQRKVDQMFLVSPFDRLYTAEKPVVPFVPNRLTMKDKFDSLLVAPLIRVPTVMLVGTNDTNVTPAMSKRLAAAFGLFPTIIEAPGATHFTITETSAYRAAAKAAFVTTKSDANGIQS